VAKLDDARDHAADQLESGAHDLKQAGVIKDSEHQHGHDQQRKQPFEHIGLSWPIRRLPVGQGPRCGNSRAACAADKPVTVFSAPSGG